MSAIRYVGALFAANFVVLYCIGWFVSLEPDVTLWSPPGRLALVMLAVLLTALESYISSLLKTEH